MDKGDFSERLMLVAGATGYLGRHVVTALHRNGFKVRALARDPEKLGDAKNLCDDVFVAKATENTTLDGLCDGVDVVFSSIGLRSFAPRPSFWEVDYQANMNILLRATSASVRHFIFISALNADLIRGQVAAADARERVVDALVGSGLTWTVLRPTGFFNDMEELFKMARRGTFYVIGDGTALINPIHGADVADQVVRCIRDHRIQNQAIGIGGPDVFTTRQIGELAFEALGRPPKIRSIPPWLLGGVSLVLSPFNPNAATLLRAMQVLSDMDMTGTPCGRHRLRDFFFELAASQPS
ncbi:MAG: NAD(P)H-binding protein [Proteobacteria bacterium]|nr:NAD(P)H-binding protein [Pseudomonadota bacterium]